MCCSGDRACDCGCGLATYPRHFMTKQELRERLSDYEDQLKKELAGVEERIQEIEGK